MAGQTAAKPYESMEKLRGYHHNEAVRSTVPWKLHIKISKKHENQCLDIRGAALEKCQTKKETNKPESERIQKAAQCNAIHCEESDFVIQW